MKVELNGYEMEYRDAGAGQPLLLIHGYPLSNALWEHQIQSLSGQMRLVAPDLRGHGESQPIAGPYSVDQLAADCAALLDHLEIRQPVWVGGLSMGGYVAFAFYRSYPERVAGLLLAATRAGADSAEAREKRDQAVARAQEKGSQAIAADMLPKMMASKTYETQPALVNFVQRMMENTSVEGIVGALAALKNRPDSTPTLAQIRVPTLVLHGQDDQIIPVEEAEKMAAAIPQAKLEVIPDAGHLLNLEQPDLFNQAVEHFIGSK